MRANGKATQSHGIDVKAQFVQSASQSADARTADLDNWLADFSSPELDAIVAEALEHNRDIHVAAANLRASRAALTGQTGRLLPQVGFSGGSSRSRINVDDGMGGFEEVVDESYSATADLSWDIDLWGKLLQERGASYADYTATREEYRAMRLLVAGDTARAWFDVIEAKEILDIVEQAAVIFEQSAQWYGAAMKAGLLALLMCEQQRPMPQQHAVWCISVSTI